MERRYFLSSLGLGAAFVLTSTCLGSCKHEILTSPTYTPPNPTNPTASEFTIDLDAVDNAALKTNGGYIITHNCVVAKTTTGEYVAATITCSHQGRNQMYYNSSANNFRCSAHGATFDLNGYGTNSAGRGGLAIYKTSLKDNILTVKF